MDRQSAATRLHRAYDAWIAAANAHLHAGRGTSTTSTHEAAKALAAAQQAYQAATADYNGLGPRRNA